MIAPVRPFALMGRKKKKQNRREKVTREVSCPWQIPTYYTLWEAVDEITAQWKCAAKISLAGEQSHLSTPTQGLVHFYTVWDAHQQKRFKESWTQGARRKSLRWSVLWFVAEWYRVNDEYVLCPKVENPWSAERRGKWVPGRCSVVIQSLNFTHVESFWWCIDWKS